MTNTRCEYVGGTEGVRWFHDQTMTLTVAVRVCPHITVIAGEVYCIP
ncbi:MAG TPA: hypothetical protein VHM89_08035 [Acidimicrobiales bacterium]|nr:hypothetical protein [Acidimicrobiales bacterium]